MKKLFRFQSKDWRFWFDEFQNKMFEKVQTFDWLDKNNFLVIGIICAIGAFTNNFNNLPQATYSWWVPLYILITCVCIPIYIVLRRSEKK